MIESETLLSFMDEMVAQYSDEPLFVMSPVMHERMEQLRRMHHIWLVLPRQGRKVRKCWMRRIRRRVKRERRRYQ